MEKNIYKVNRAVKGAAGNVAAEVKNLDVGVMLTKATTVASKVDFSGVKTAVGNMVDGPKAEELKGVARTVKDFVGYAPNYVQGLVGSFKKD